MSVNYQIVGLGGNLTSDVKNISPKVVSFSIAVNSGYGEKRKTTYFNCVAFASTFHEKVWAVLTKLTKGTCLGVKGEFETNSYENKKGEKVSTLQLMVREFNVFMKPADEAGSVHTSQGASAKVGASAPVEDSPEDSDIPF